MLKLSKDKKFYDRKTKVASPGKGENHHGST